MATASKLADAAKQDDSGNNHMVADTFSGPGVLNAHESRVD